MKTDKPRNAAIIVAAGRGSRMGDAANGPKQYAYVNGRSILDCAVAAFCNHPAIGQVLVVIHPDDQALYENHVKPHDRLLDPVHGGATRQESVMRGLEALAGLHCDLECVLIHDAARPLVSEATISATLQATGPGIGALPGIPVADTLKQAEPAPEGFLIVTNTRPRDGLYQAQTPQTFRFADILEAHRQAWQTGARDHTDDSAVAERFGMAMRLVAGNRENIKITTPDDLDYIRYNSMIFNIPNVLDVRTGNGYDVHRLVPGGPAILCGVEIPSDLRADGHSDADVGLHALTDALLGTIGDGDIGSHFPPSDPQWKGAASYLFLKHARQLVHEKGGQITHLDVTIICERPKVGPHRDAMRASIAEICNIEIGRVSVKATTHERIGSLGRSEGIAAIATATVVMASQPDSG